MTHAHAVTLLDAFQDAQAALYEHENPAAVAQLMAEDVTWTVPGKSPIAGTYVGRTSVIEYMLARARIAGHTFRMHRRAVLTGDGYVVALTDGDAVILGERHTWQTLGLYEAADDLITSCRLVPFDQAEFDAIWTP